MLGLCFRPLQERLAYARDAAKNNSPQKKLPLA